MAQITLLAVSNTANSKTLKELLDYSRINCVAMVRPEESQIEKAESFPVNGIVMFSDNLTDEECSFINSYYLARKDTVAILITTTITTEILTKAMANGIYKVISIDDGKESICKQIIAEAERMQKRHQAAEVSKYDSKIITVFGTKGGSGKTTLSTNIAAGLALRGKKVAIVDLDLQFGDVGVFFNINKAKTISDIIADGDLNPFAVKDALYHTTFDVDALVAPVSPELAEVVKPQHVSKIITGLRPEYDYVIIDAAPIVDDNSITALDESDIVFFVTNPEISTLKNTKICLSVLSTLGYAPKVHLVLNRQGASDISPVDVKKTIGTEPAAVVPLDAKVAISSINQGKPVVLSNPRSPMSQAIMQLIDVSILHRQPEKKKFSFFRR